MTDNPRIVVPASLPRRLAAMFYDSLLLAAIAWAITAIAIALRVAQLGDQAIRQSAAPATGGPLLQLALLLSIVAFFCWFWTRSGQTLGMQAWRLRVETIHGDRIGWRQSLARLAGAVVSAACFGAGFWWLLFDAEGRTWHDRWSNSRVVLTGAK